MPDYFFFDSNRDSNNAEEGEKIQVDLNYGTLNSIERISSCSSLFGSTGSLGSLIRSSPSMLRLPAASGKPLHSIRFQIVIWYIGPVDVVIGKVDMRFRVTIFWNAPEDFDDEEGYGRHNNPTKDKKVWTMHGRQRAYLQEINRNLDDTQAIYVPPVSILNAVDFDTLGEPEVCLIDRSKKLFKWSCLYKASMAQEHLQVSNFPHDVHDLVVRFAILKHRQHRKRWDRNRWKLALATNDDTHDSIRIPHGLIVDHVRVPGFSFQKEKGLTFEFRPLDFGGGVIRQEDTCLQVKLRVRRDSSYYDRNIIPLLAALNIVAISTLALSASDFGNRAQIILASSFVEIGIRMTLDSRLPDVGYQIKMQVVLNNFFLGLLFLALVSSCNYLIVWNRPDVSFWVDITTAIFGLSHLILTLLYYYVQRDKGHSLESNFWTNNKSNTTTNNNNDGGGESTILRSDSAISTNRSFDTNKLLMSNHDKDSNSFLIPDKETVGSMTPDANDDGISGLI